MRLFPLLAGALVFPLAAQQPQFDVHETTIAQIHSAMQSGRLTCHALVQTYLDRIAANDKQGPAINAITVVNPDALATADSLDRRYAASKQFVGSLHCIPIIVKDNFQTIGLQTAAGSLALKGYTPLKDAFEVRRIKEAGAVILAKSNMAEWAFSPLETVNSLLPGYTKNPYALDRVTAGSSGGTAASVADNLGEVGLGTDTGNSIRGPSSHQSLVGIRSTIGVTSRAGVVPLVLFNDVAGPMARTVADAVAVFQVVAGYDPDDPATLPMKDKPVPNYASFLQKDGLKGARIGVLRQAYDRRPQDNDPEVMSVFANALDEMRRAGATVIDSAMVPDSVVFGRGGGGGGRGAGGGPAPTPCMGFKMELNGWLASQGDRVPVHSLDEVLKSNKYHPSIQKRLETAQAAPDGDGPDSPACQPRQARRERVRSAVERMMDSLKLDALVYPTWSNPPRLIGDMTTPAGDNSQVFSPTTGNPAIQVPMGFTRNNTLPAGMTIFGRAFDEGRLIKLAYSYEQATHHRHPPPLP